MKILALDVWVRDGHQSCSSVHLQFEYKVERVSNNKNHPSTPAKNLQQTTKKPSHQNQANKKDPKQLSNPTC